MKKISKCLACLLAVAIAWAPIPVLAEDIDIFTGGSIAASNPSILIVLDNESQWANAAQQWPGGIQQGQAEANAIKQLLSDSTVINSGVNVGLMEFVTAGNANNTGGFMRFPISQMTDPNKATLSAHMDTIYNNITSSNEKRNSGTTYGNLMWEVYNYLSGSHTVDTLSPPNPSADGTAYTTPYTVFKSPITAANGCGRIFMIFIGNNTGSNSPVTNDTQTNKNALSALGCSTTSVPLPNFTTQSVAQQVALGSGTYASQAACEAAAATAYTATAWATGTAYTVGQKVSYSGSIYNVIVAHTSSNATQPDADSTDYAYSSPVFTSYTCTAASASTTQTTLATSTCGQYASATACQSAAAVTYGAAYNSYTCDVAAACSGSTALGTSNCGQYASAAACETGTAAAFPGYSSYSCSASALTCGGGTSTLALPAANSTTPTACGLYATQAACQTAAAALYGASYASYACTSAGSCKSGDLDGAACYADSTTCQSAVSAANPGYNSVSCATGATACNQTVTTCAANNAYNNSANCNAGAPGLLPAGTYTSYSCNAGANCSGGKTWTITGFTGTNSYSAIGTGTRWTVTGTQASTGTRYDMVGTGGGSTYTIKGNTTTTTYNIFGNYTATLGVPTGTYNTTANSYMADEWTSCLHQNDLSPDGAAAVAEAFTADFNTSGAIVGADTITFDGATTTLSGGEAPADIATKVAATSYTNWIATSSAPGVVTFSHISTGPLTDVGAGSFSIFDAGSSGTGPVVVVTTTTQGATATGGALGKQNVTTYTIDVYNAKQNTDETALSMSMAQQGGGRYFAAKSQAQILAALKQIVSEIQSVNTAFAAASIPLSTTNRSQNLNEVYIGVFRPSLEPRWFGNLKKFQIAKINGVLDLVDSVGSTALNSQTGFLNDCGVSFWTTDSGAWWDQVKIGALNLASNSLINPTPKSSCLAMPAASTSPWSDLPDGQSVEKGAVAEVIRRGNNPPSTSSSPTWTVNRTIYTRSGSSLAALDATSAGSANLYDYIRGADINVDGAHVEEKTLSPSIANAVRASVHGDVVHSRPLAVNYDINDTVIYYGANDGMLRAVDGATGKEKWAFIPPEFLDTTKQTRLMQDTPYIAFGAAPAAGSTPKNYLFDGSPGLYQSLGNTKVWLYPTQRRGGRMVHALDVTTNTAPSLKWYQGCPHLGDDTGCTSSFDGIGQTWSTPVVTKIKGYSTTRPVVAFGGGYDACEDTVPLTNPPTWTTTCASAKGRAVYMVDAEDGTLIKKFTFSDMRGVTAGISFVDINNDGYADYGYVADLGGTLYRLSLVNSPATPTPLDKDDWSIKKIAYTSGARKFMFAPAVVFGGGSTVYAAMGSGDRERPLAEDYPYAMNVRNYVYAYRDTLDAFDAATTACNLDGAPAAADSCVLDYTAAPAACGSPGILPSESKKAWRVGFVYQGEQAVTQPIILGGMVALNTTRPVPAGVCSAALGEGGGYFLNLINGSGAIGVTGNCGGEIRGAFLGVGLPTDPVVVNLPGEDPICIGCVSKSNTNPSLPSKLFQPTPVPPPISKAKSKKYRYRTVD